MPDGVDGARFVEEAADDLLVAAQRDVQHLDGDLASDHRVLGQVDGAHPALAEKLDDLVVADRLIDQGYQVTVSASHGRF